VTFAVTALIVRVPTWYEARYVLPIAGMVIGNAMTGIALTLERLFADLDARSAEILGLTALGASVWEAARPSVRAALKAGMMPTINSMAAAGVVFIPGMMTGQVLAGADPVEAAKYQIVVMLMIAAATGIAAIAATLLMYRRRFTREGVFLEPGLRGYGSAWGLSSRARICTTSGHTLMCFWHCSEGSASRASFIASNAALPVN